jgi:hypothetical protein
MKKMALLAAVVSALAFSSAAAAGTPATVSTSTLDNLVAYNQCTGELLLLNGTVHWTSRFVDDGSGEHVVYSLTYANVTADAPATGAEYVVTQAFHVASYLDPTSFDFLPTVMQIEDELTMVRLGDDFSYPAGDDFHLFIRSNLVIDANGVTRVDQNTYRIACL